MKNYKKILIGVGLLCAIPSMSCSAFQHTPETIKVSDDNHVTYMKDYVGMNLANTAYWASAGMMRIQYIASNMLANIEVLASTPDGKPIEEDDMQNYYIVAQSIEPNSVISTSYSLEDGEESMYISHMSPSAIRFTVLPVGTEPSDDDLNITKVNVSEDANAEYIRDYRGLNLGMIGEVYSSDNGVQDEYGEADVILVPNSTDGSYIDPSDEENLKNFVIIGQDVAPNSKITVTYDDSNNFVRGQNISTINVSVVNVDSYDPSLIIPIEESETETETTTE